ncbi:MAG: hypothetical protein ACFFCW_23385 [Candidatus Hodarchaeota archaeon]
MVKPEAWCEYFAIVASSLKTGIITDKPKPEKMFSIISYSFPKGRLGILLSCSLMTKHWL